MEQQIQTEEENELALEEINLLMSKPEELLSPEEGERLNLLGILVEEFEQRYGFESLIDQS